MVLHPIWDPQEMANAGPCEVLALGDSWFHYPLSCLLNPIFRDSGNKVMFCLGANGAEAEEFLHDYYRKPFVESLKGYNSVRTVLLSAGGNDFAGLDDFTTVLRPVCSGAKSAKKCFRSGQPARLLNRIIGYYDELVALVKKHRPESRVLVHNYDYAIPNGKGFLGFGQWLKAPMDQAKVPKPDEWALGSLRREVVKELIDQFGRKLEDFATQSKNRVTFVKTSGRITKDEHWANEMHPTPEGFEEVGKAFQGLV